MPTQNELITQFLQALYQGKQFLTIEEDSYGINDILPELFDAKLIKIDGDFYKLTDKGRFLIKDGKSYDDFERERREPPKSNVQIGHNITGSTITGSDLSQDNSHFKRSLSSNSQKPAKEVQTTTTTSKVMSWVKIISAIIAAVAAAIALFSGM